jgi:hypothetical protein
MHQSHRISTRSVVLVTAALCAACIWFVGGLTSAPAQAQIPDSGAQLQQVIAELQQLNRQVAELRELVKQTRDATVPADAKKPGSKPK